MDEQKAWAKQITADSLMQPREPDPFEEWARKAAGHPIAFRVQIGDEEPRLVAVHDPKQGFHFVDAEA